MRSILVILALFISTNHAFAYNPFWTHIDKKLIAGIVSLDKFNPNEVEQYFKKRFSPHTTENLGFGWKLWSPGVAGGYIRISAKFYYYRDSLACYFLIPELPEEKGLQDRYKKWYKDYFVYSGNTIQPFKFHESTILRPLKEYDGNLKMCLLQLPTT